MAIRCILCGEFFYKGSSIHFHSLPSKEEERNKWLDIIQLSGQEVLHGKRYLCSQHFPPECYTKSNSKLKPGSLPSLKLQRVSYQESESQLKEIQEKELIAAQNIFSSTSKDAEPISVELHSQQCITCWTTDSNSYFKITKKFYSGTAIKDAIILLVPQMAEFLQDKHRVCRNCTKTLDAALKFITQCNFVQVQLKAGNFKEPSEGTDLNNHQAKDTENENIQIAAEENQDYKNIDIQESVLHYQDYSIQEKTEDQEEHKDINILQNAQFQNVKNLNLEENSEQLQNSTATYQKEYTHVSIKEEIEECIDENIQTDHEQYQDCRVVIKQDEADEAAFEDHRIHVENPNLQISDYTINQVYSAVNIPDFGTPSTIISIRKSDSMDLLVNKFSNNDIAVYDQSEYSNALTSKRIILLGSLVCFFCGKSYQTKQQLEMHKLRQHINIIKTNASTMSEKKRLKKIKYRCRKCYQGFYKHSEFKKHTRIHPLPIKCKKCNKKFDDINSFTAHYNTLHRDEKQSESYLCDICGKYFSLKHKYTQHRKVHVKDKNFVCEFCGAIFDCKDKAKNHRFSHLEKTFKCDRCSKMFRTSVFLKRHIQRTHEPEETNNFAQCDQCGKLVKNKLTLSTHMSLVHSKLGLVQCPECPKTYTSSFYLHRHVKYVHRKTKCKTYMSKGAKVNENDRKCRTRLTFNTLKGISPTELLPCKICGKHFKGLHYLKLHLRTHVLTKRFICRHCGMTLKSSNTLVKHEQTHQENMLRCNVCWKRFESEKDLQQHTRIHNKPRHQCSECGKYYNRKFLLDNHFVLNHSTSVQLELTLKKVVNDAIDQIREDREKNIKES